MRASSALLAFLLLLPLAAASHNDGTGPRSLGGQTLPQEVPVLLRLEAEAFDERPLGALVDDANATGGKAWRMEQYGRISFKVDVPSTGVVWLWVRARGEHAPDLLTTHMHPVVDGDQRGEWDVGPRYATFRQSVPVLAGSRVISVDNFNNYHAPAADRTLVVDWIEVSAPFLEGAPRVGPDRPAFVDGPQIHEAGTGMARMDDADARNGTSWQMWGIGCFGLQLVADAPWRYQLDARLRGNTADGVGSRTTVRIDGVDLMTTDVGDAYEVVSTPLQLAQGPAILHICYDNDYGGAQKRNLWLDELTITPVEVGAPVPTPATPAPTPTTPTALTPTPVASTPAASPTPTGAPAAPSQVPGPSPSAAPSPTPSPDESTAPVPLAPWVALAALGIALAARRR